MKDRYRSMNDRHDSIYKNILGWLRQRQLAQKADLYAAIIYASVNLN